MINDPTVQTFEEVISENSEFCTHAFIVYKPFAERFHQIAREANRAVASPRQYLTKAGYVGIDETFFSSGIRAYQVKWQNTLSTVFVRPYIKELWRLYKETSSEKRKTFPGLMRYIIDEYKQSSLPHYAPLISDYYRFSDIAPPKDINESDLADEVERLILDPDYAYATPHYACLSPIVKDVASKFDMKPFYPTVRRILEDFGYVDVRNVPSLQEYMSRDGMVYLPAEFGSHRTRTPVFVTMKTIKAWPRFHERTPYQYTVTQFLVDLHNVATKNQKEAA